MPKITGKSLIRLSREISALENAVQEIRTRYVELARFLIAPAFKSKATKKRGARK